MVTCPVDKYNFFSLFLSLCHLHSNNIYTIVSRESSTHPPRHEVWRVGLDQELVEGDVASHVFQREGAPTGVCEEGGQADV